VTVAYLGLGSNLGTRSRNLSAARRRLRQKGARILRQSRVIESEPWGVADQPRFLNQVLEVDWGGTPRELLRAAKSVEREGGRRPTALAHEFGHALGLGHSARVQDLMFPSTARTTGVFSADERVLLTMMYIHRRPGQVAPDNDQALGQGASGTVRVIAQ